MNALKILLTATALLATSAAVAQPLTIEAEGQLLVDCDADGTRLQVVVDTVEGDAGIEAPEPPAAAIFDPTQGWWDISSHTCSQPSSATLDFELSVVADVEGEIQDIAMTLYGPSGQPYQPTQTFVSVVPTVDICDILDVKE